MQFKTSLKQLQYQPYQSWGQGLFVSFFIPFSPDWCSLGLAGSPHEDGLALWIMRPRVMLLLLCKDDNNNHPVALRENCVCEKADLHL